MPSPPWLLASSGPAGAPAAPAAAARLRAPRSPRTPPLVGPLLKSNDASRGQRKWCRSILNSRQRKWWRSILDPPPPPAGGAPRGADRPAHLHRAAADLRAVLVRTGSARLPTAALAGTVFVTVVSERALSLPGAERGGVRVEGGACRRRRGGRGAVLLQRRGIDRAAHGLQRLDSRGAGRVRPGSPSAPLPAVLRLGPKWMKVEVDPSFRSCFLLGRIGRVGCGV
jgi:hypothetical protein